MNLQKLVSDDDHEQDTFMTTYPTRSINLLADIGMIVPPTEAPKDITPNASDRRFKNHCEATAGIGPKIIPQATPVRIP